MLSARTLKTYVASRFLLAIAAAFVMCSILIFMIDFIELLRQSGKHGRVGAALLAYMALLRLPAYTEFLLAFTVLVGSIGALLMLNRKNELTVMRAGGMSAWQFIGPGIAVAATLGVLFMAVYNPLAAQARGEAERLYAEAFGRDSNVLQSKSAEGAWLRQDGLDGQSIISAAHASKEGLGLTQATVFVFDGAGAFVERIDAAKAELQDGFWLLTDAWVARIGQPPEKYGVYYLSTYLTPDRVAAALGTMVSLSFWELPALIEVAERAKLSTSRLRLQLESLIARPFLCAAMVLLAATVSLRSFRSGGIQTMVVTGIVGAFGFFFLSEVSRQLGVAALVPAWVAVWPPICLAALVSLTVLLHQEDG